ncbi:copper amine oxidase N-terminal domain-containing protein [Paenibacillus endoradicis]|uniref:copper amine oxidase N-terminal domain-containing protein n=1 Tax=Paenibacillus endoradicis TaxID=2972487 RepID=UPI002158BCD1|nr:copper amine oxidase N-terminal domain-containing protein [Paenibacillus endoradicis]MCR8656986.1 copper amine oxidase N-terminal domain-containing protein [Paenibacillus endoradicis]
MLKIRSVKKLVALILICSLVILAGCQAIGGVDINAALKKSLKVTSTEGNSSMEFKLHFNEKALLEDEYFAGDEEFISMLRLFSNVKVSITDIKMQDQQNISFKGSLTLGDLSQINFELKMSETLLIVSLDGATRSFTFDLTGETAERLMYDDFGMTYEDGEFESEYVVDDEKILATIQSATELVTDFGIEKLPNIEKVSVTPVTEEINGVSTSLMKIHGELKGMELWNWGKKLTDALLEDRTGLEKLLGEVLNLFMEDPEMIDYLGIYVSDDFTDGNITEADKKVLIDEVVTAIITSLEDMKISMVEFETKDKEILEMALNDSLEIKFDLYVDSNLDIRKQAFSLNYVVSDKMKEELGTSIFEGLTITSENEAWNVNGKVAPKVPVASGLEVQLESLDYLEGFEVLKYFDNESVIYDLLRNKLHITEQYYWNYIDEDTYNAAFVNADKFGMIPVRELIEEFGGNVKFDKATNQITVYDKATKTTIKLQIGSDKAIINGETVQWPTPVITHNGATYAPARAFATALGAEIVWNSEYGEVDITREP